jgi:uncharacterized membrane protein YcaP (DUF421 family)
MSLSRKRHFVALAIGLGSLIVVNIVNSPVLHSITITIAFVLSVILFSGIGRKRP